MYGRLNENQAQALRPHVAGKLVHDLGSGDLTLSHALLDLGASEVVAIDRHTPSRSILKKASPKIRFVGSYFHDFHEPVETAFVSWPINWYDYALSAILAKSKTVIYLGSNFDGTACGFPDMWIELASRPVHAHFPSPANTLIVYGHGFEKREPLPEEYAAIHQEKGVFRYSSEYGP